jgi:hypothetical protein
VPFDFDQCTEQYRSEAARESRYSREKSWDYLWDYVQPSARTRDGRSTLVTGRRLELTALHIGFYLASWGMFRGQLLYQNLDFFKALSEHIFVQLNPQFWNVTFAGFGEDSQSVDIFDGAREIMVLNIYSPTIIVPIASGCPKLCWFGSGVSE